MKFIMMVMAAITLATTAHAKETDWQQHGVEVKTRLIGSSDVAGDNTKVWLAWEAQMIKGWKTYWRSPGDAGLPVVLTINGKKVDLAYPLPGKFSILGIETLGYEKSVVIPFQVDKSLLESDTVLDVTFMVCKDICIPYKTSYTPPKMKRLNYDMLISGWLKKVPQRGGSEDLYIAHHRVTGPKGSQRLMVDVVGIKNPQQAVLYVEGPEGVAFTEPRMTNKGGYQRLVVKALGMDVPDLQGVPLRVTLTDGAGKAVDITLE